MDSYPFGTSFLYSGPLNYVLAYPLVHQKVSSADTGRSWLMDKRGDNLEKSITEYTLGEVISGLDSLTGQWEKGLPLLEAGLNGIDSPEKTKEINTARACFHIFRSGRNTYQAYRLNRRWRKSDSAEFLKIAQDELENLREVLPIVSGDKRLGFHSEVQDYMFTPALIQTKIASLESMLNG
jgi:hypothetical protein